MCPLLRRAPAAARLFASIRLATLAIPLATAPARALPVLNEVLYDPTGTDSGREFVELYNPGPDPFPLAGCKVEFANGAVAIAWATRWTGSAADTLAPGGLFLIADAGWTGPPEADATTSLALQNGPDAVRLLLPSGEADRLGYGALTDPAFYEGAPHAGSGSGKSLVRRADGVDTDDNAADWEAADPSPGRLNQPALAAVVDAFAVEPPSLPAAGLEAVVALHLVNTGLTPLGGPVRLRDEGGRDGPNGWLDPLPPGEGRVLRLSWRPATEGLRAFSLEIAGGGSPPLTVPAGGFMVGLPDVYLNEVMAAPPRAGCEWLELGNAAAAPVDLATLRLRDEDGEWRPLPAHPLAPGRLVVVAQDRDKFAVWWRGLAAAGAPAACPAESVQAGTVELAGGWPSLNNSPPEDRDFADRLYLGDADGTVLDHVTLGAGGARVPVERSLERVAPRPLGAAERNWGAATAAPGGTPGCPNSLSAPALPTARLTLQPNLFAPAAGGVVHLLFTVADGEQGWDARVYDLWGRRVRDLGSDRLGSGPRDVVWDGSDDTGARVGVGGYVVLVRVVDEGGRPRSGSKRLVVVEAP